MFRELSINLYLIFTRILFSIFSIIPLKNKTVFIASFGSNIQHVRKQCLKETNHDIIILVTKGTQVIFEPSERERVYLFEATYFIQFILSFYHIATAKFIFVDNYFGFLAATPFKESVKVIQLWHAAGAIKRFGLKDPSTLYRSYHANKRFRKVYQRFTQVVVGSDKMVDIFKQTFHLKEHQFLRTGIPRTDFFYDNHAIKEAKLKLYGIYPQLVSKKVLLYAPTFRDGEIDNYTLQIDIDLLNEHLGNDFVLLIRLHPAVKHISSAINNSCLINVSDYPNLNELLIITDYLITDYSSVPFEFALLNRPIIFYSYDYEKYLVERGFFEDYKKAMPGPVVNSTIDVIKEIQNNAFDYKRLAQFASEWNRHSKGNAAELLVKALYK